MIKTLTQLEKEGKFLKMIKGIYKMPTVKLKHTCRRLNFLLPSLATRNGYPVTTLIQRNSESLASAIKVSKKDIIY